MKLLREFIRENLGMMFGLDRQVSMNALSNTISGPDAIDSMLEDDEYDPETTYELVSSFGEKQLSAVDYLTGLQDSIDTSAVYSSDEDEEQTEES